MTLRNLKDTMVSFFHHFIGMKPTNSGTEPGTKEEWSVYFKYLLHSDEGKAVVRILTPDKD